ncbi:TPA: phage tail protein [Salmonella enterica subsp. diarizonae serovar 57:c:e,n,x,z15]|nr:phage tail protein [Salmonella enterica subsp. diarizonae serovar 57:c:e,n,x,z15]
MADYYSIITNRGKELEAEALASGRLIVLTHFVVGDSNGKQVRPDPAQIRLINETYRGDIAELVVSPEQSTQLMAKIVLPTGIGGFTVREVGLMTDAGDLYAVANCPSIDKPVGGVSVNMQFRLAVSDSSNITLNVATGDGLFLRIDQNLKEIKSRGAEAQKTSRESIGVLDGTTQQRGLVQLSSSVNSTSETQAATPAAVKIVMDNANARLAKDRNGADIPNVALFLQNLGLGETINLAKNAVPSTRRVNDKPLSGDITLSAADVNAFALGMTGDYTLENDKSVGWNWKSGVYNVPTGGASKLILHFNMNIGSCPAVQFCVNYKNGGISYRSARDDFGFELDWTEFYTTTRKPSAGDVGALPVSGGVINGNLGIGTPNILGGSSIVLGDNDTGLKQNGDGLLDIYANGVQVFRFQNDTLESKKSINVTGRLTPTDYGNFDSRYVQDFRLGSYESGQAWMGPGFSDTPGYVLTAATNGNGDELIDGLGRRPMQKLIGNQWYNVTSV